MRAKWYFLGCLSSIIILVLLISLGISSLVKLTKASTNFNRVKDNSVLYLKLRGPYQAYSNISDRNFKFIPDTSHDIIQKIRSAKEDPKIKAILLEPQFVTVGLATAGEIVKSLRDFKSSGKKIYGYLTSGGQTDILLLSAADVVAMNPSLSAGFFLEGVGGAITYYKDLFDNLGIKVHIIRAGEYKAAGENYTRSTMSPEFRENISEIYSDVYQVLVNDLARSYDLPTSAVRYTIESNERWMLTAEMGKDLRIVDEALYFEQFLKSININSKQLVKLNNYTAETPKPAFNHIAVVYALGNISPVKAGWGENNISSAEYVKLLDELENDYNVKAIVLRISSGGGSALESELIYQKIVQVREKKPVVVSMGAVAASGGYYIAAPANYIYADPYTITGSIGVVSMLPDFSSTAKKIGVNDEIVGSGKYLAPMSSFWNLYNPDVEKAMQTMIDDIYLEFKTRVSASRDISLNNLEKIAQGKVWSAQKALEHHLIDGIGQLDDAIIKAAQLASVSNFSVSYYPERKQFIDIILEDSFNFSSIKSLLAEQLVPDYIKFPRTLQQIYEEIKDDPFQMRSEINFDLQ